MCNVELLLIFKKLLIYDVEKTPFIFKLDKTTATQVWSSQEDQIVNIYVGSLFLGHCNHKQLVQHYKEFKEDLNLESSCLVHCRMDVPNVNSVFENKLDSELSEKTWTMFITPGVYCI